MTLSLSSCRSSVYHFSIVINFCIKSTHKQIQRKSSIIIVKMKSIGKFVSMHERAESVSFFFFLLFHVSWLAPRLRPIYQTTPRLRPIHQTTILTGCLGTGPIAAAIRGQSVGFSRRGTLPLRYPRAVTVATRRSGRELVSARERERVCVKKSAVMTSLGA